MTNVHDITSLMVTRQRSLAALLARKGYTIRDLVCRSGCYYLLTALGYVEIGYTRKELVRYIHNLPSLGDLNVD